MFGRSSLQKRSKTRTEAFRFDVGLIEGLERAAKHADMTKNAFVSALLAERLRMEPLVRTYHWIRLSAETFQSILGGTDRDTLEMAGSEMARKDFPLIIELYRSSGHPLAIREFLAEILGKHGGWFSEEGGDDGSQRWMTLRHSFGLKWSIFVKSYVLGAHGTISKDKIKIEIADQFIRIDFSPA